MTVHALETPKFLRKTTLRPNERNTNFIMTDRDVLEAVTSAAADKVTPLMSKIYNRLKLANQDGVCQERDGVLHFAGEMREGKRVGAWDQLCDWLRVSSETAKKALSWMHDEGVIGYKAFRNGVGIWIFLNRAASSVVVGAARTGQKNLTFRNTSPGGRRASAGEAGFNDTFGDSEGSENTFNSCAPQSGADKTEGGQKSSGPAARSEHVVVDGAVVAEIARQVRSELEPCIRSSAVSAAVEAVSREQAKTREWFEQKALPKAARVAQRETYDILRRSGEAGEKERRARAELEVGRSTGAEGVQVEARPLGEAEIDETAEMCVALYVVQGVGIDVTLSGLACEVGGMMLPEDAPKVRERAQKLLREREGRCSDVG